MLSKKNGKGLKSENANLKRFSINKIVPSVSRYKLP